MRIYAACLAAYNNGILHGAWIDASSDVDTMQEAIAAMLEASPIADAEEWAIHDYDDFPNLGEYPGLEAIAAYAELIEDHDHIDAADLAAIVSDFGTVAEAAEALRDNFAGIFSTFRDYADDAADEAIAAHTADGKAPQMLINYFDYDAWARDLQIEMRTTDCPSGVAVFYG